jgi:rare lipoprotein A
MMRIGSLTALLIVISTPPAFAHSVRATWYGNELAGHRTASGVPFNPNGHTVAHKTLPFGTCLIVQNPNTGKEVRVTVNDRGPFTSGVTLDLSHGAAQAIGMRSTQSVDMRHC